MWASVRAGGVGKRHRKRQRNGKVAVVMHEFKEGTLHSGSSSGPVVHERDQAIAIALSEARKATGKRKFEGKRKVDA